ncbi:MAG: hypothetical protein EU532_12440 [Promethearchaeota archaeon]|nr:MAG: hypothetical protein EU532_12440 [Candidatus Lokiarchaeota archaeon]
MAAEKQMIRSLAIRIWITNINEGIYDEEENIFKTIFGKVKRVLIIATIREKREITLTNQSNSYNIDGISSNFELDDGTGLINAVKWNMSSNEYENLKIGDLVLVIGRLKSRFGSISLTIEIIKKIKDPNDLLLQDAFIIKKIKSGKVEKLPLEEQKFDEFEFETESFGNDSANDNSDQLKIRVLNFIQKNTKNSKGTRLIELKNNLEINEKELRRIIRDLEYEAKIFLSDEDSYLSWD